MKRYLITLSSITLASALVQAQRVTPDTVQQAIAFATESQSASNPTEAVRAFMGKMSKAFGPGAPVSLYQTAGLDVSLITPMTVLRGEIAGHLRKMEPLPPDVATLAGVGISIEPKRIDSPDIATVVLLRDKQRVAPIRSALAPQTLNTAAGLTVVKHSGMVFFPESAFVPGASVHLSLIPEAGLNIEIDVPIGTLALIFATVDQLSGSLVGHQMAEIELRVGKASTVEGLRRRYSTSAGTLTVYYDDKGMATDVQPTNLPLLSVK